jgi:hypothetical protein
MSYKHFGLLCKLEEDKSKTDGEGREGQVRIFNKGA